MTKEDIGRIDIRSKFSEIYQQQKPTVDENELWILFVKAQEQRIDNFWTRKITRYFEWIESEDRELLK